MGERWVMDQCFKSTGFKLRETVCQAAPCATFRDIRMYAGARIPGVRMDMLVYFAASVFWRAGVHYWRLGARTPIHVQLGPYEGKLREFLLGKGPFPAGMTLLIAVSDRQDLLEFAFFPESRKGPDRWSHRFNIPGITFALDVGARQPQDFYRLCSAHAPDKPLYVLPSLDEDLRLTAARLLRH